MSVRQFQTGRAFAVACLLLSGCSAADIILPGERVGLYGDEPVVQTNASQPIRLSAQVNHASWTHRAGTASHSIQHAAFSAAPTQIWATEIGEGADRKHRITTDPVAAAGRIFTIDSRASVSAVASSGALLWSRDLTPATENKDDASGGGLAVSGEWLYATTGFGELVALNVATGAEAWRQKLEAPVTGAPTVQNGILYVVTRDNRAWAINAADGRVRWQFPGTPASAGVVGGSGPAVGAKLAVFPFGSGELIATLPKGGLRVWNASVAGARTGKAYANVSDVTGDPVIKNNVVYAGNASGRTIALDAATGDRLWTATEGALGPVWVEGGSVFLVSDQAELVRLNASNGQRIWGATLPNVVPVRNQLRTRDVYTHFGPILAGGRLWVASNDGNMRAFDPVKGSLLATVSVPGGAASRPIVVGGTMYIVNQTGQLLAFR